MAIGVLKSHSESAPAPRPGGTLAERSIPRICLFSIPPWQEQPVAVASEARIDAVLAAKATKCCTERSSVATHNLRSTMRENGLFDMRPVTPIELRGNRGMAYQDFAPPAYNRTLQRRAIADIDVDATQRCGGMRKLGHIRQVEKRHVSSRDAVADTWRTNGMLNRIGFEAYPTDRHGPPGRNLAWIADWKVVQQAQRLARGINRAGRTLGEPSGVVAMSVSKNNCSRRDGAELAQPIRPAIDHNSSAIVPDQQCTVSAMPA